MIYVFRFVPDEKHKYKCKLNLTLTADTKTQLFTRIQSQYGVPKENIEIIKEIKEEDVKE